jgi:hypothetical protein
MSIFNINLYCSPFSGQKAKLLYINDTILRTFVLYRVLDRKSFRRKQHCFARASCDCIKDSAIFCRSPYCIFNFLEVLELETDKSKIHSWYGGMCVCVCE